MEKFSRPVIEEGPAAANPAVFPNTVYNAAGGQVAMKVGADRRRLDGHGRPRGRRVGDLLRLRPRRALDQADAVVCLAADTLTDTRDRAPTGPRPPGRASRRRRREASRSPRRGIALVLERRVAGARREARGSTARCSATASPATRSGVGKFDREGHGLERAMRIALERSGLEAGDIRPSGPAPPGSRSADEPERRGDRSASSATSAAGARPEAAARRADGCRAARCTRGPGAQELAARRHGAPRPRSLGQQLFARRHALLARVLAPYAASGVRPSRPRG